MCAFNTSRVKNLSLSQLANCKDHMVSPNYTHAWHSRFMPKANLNLTPCDEITLKLPKMAYSWQFWYALKTRNYLEKICDRFTIYEKDSIQSSALRPLKITEMKRLTSMAAKCGFHLFKSIVKLSWAMRWR